METFGSKLETPDPDVDRLAPDAADVANATLQQLIDRGLNRTTSRDACRRWRAPVADGIVRLEPPVDFAAMRGALQELPGIGPWTAEYVAMRALGDPDAFPHSDLGLLNALQARETDGFVGAAPKPGGRFAPTPRCTFGTAIRQGG